MKKKLSIIAVAVLTLVLTAAVGAQVASGGSFTLSQAVTSNGGGQMTSASFTATTTVGQSIAGNNSTGGGFGLRSGFWQGEPLGPTAAAVSVTGRVSTFDGAGLRNAVVEVRDSHGVTIRVLTSSFGYYRFDDVPAGETYIVSVTSKRYQFAPRVIGLTDAVADLDFIALP